MSVDTIKFNLQKLFLVFLSALFYIHTYPANDYPLLAWITFIPLFLALDSGAWKQNLLLTLLFSTIIFLIYLWMPYYHAVFSIFSDKTLGISLIFVHLFSYMIPFMLFGILYHHFSSYRIQESIILASLFTVLTLSLPTLFSYNIATSLYEYPSLIQVVDISGISLLLWFIVLVNLSLKNIIMLLWQKCFNKDLFQNIAMTLFSFLFIVAYGYWHLNVNVYTQHGEITVTTIQPNMNSRFNQLYMIRDNKKSTPFSHIELTRKALAQSKQIDLIVWPEGGLVVDCENEVISNKLSEFTQEIERPLMYQCNHCLITNQGETCYNQSCYMDRDGQIKAVYNKQNLIPIFEHIPDFFANFVTKELHGELLFEKGESNQLFLNSQAKIIPSICYDAHSNLLIQKGVDLTGNLLVIQSNNSIFQESAIGLFDTAINIMDATSFRIPMVKSCNSGYGVFSSAKGEILFDSLTPLNQKYISTHTIKIEETFSLFRVLGDWFYDLLFLFLIYIFLLKLNRFKR